MESNKLIAEFMGDITSMNAKVSFSKNCGVNDLQYHTSWDWLMPVAEKIYKERGLDDEIILMIRGSVAELNIESMYKTIVEFIKQHNDGK